MAFRCLHSQWFRIADCAAESFFRNSRLPSYMHRCLQMHTRCSTYCPSVEDAEEKSAVSVSNQETFLKTLNCDIAREAKFFRAGTTVFEDNIQRLLRKVVSSYQKEEAAALDVLELSRCFIDLHELVEVLPSLFSEFIKVLAGKKMLEDAVGVFVQARENQVEPSICSCNFLLKCLMEGKKGKVFTDVFDHLRNSGPPPNVHTYTILLNSYRSSGSLHKVDLVREIDEVLHEMERFGLTPSVVTYGTVIQVLCEAGYVEYALDFVRKSRNKAACKFNKYCYNPIIDGFCHTGKVDEALELLEEMRRCSVSPDVYSYSILIHGFCQKGDISKCFSLWQEMKVRHIKPNIVTLTSLFSPLGKTGRVKNFMEKSCLVDDRDFECDETFYNILIEDCSVSGNLRKANQLLEEMTKKGLNPKPYTFNKLIQAFSKDESFQEEGLQVFNTMQKALVAPNIITCNVVVGLHCREGRPLQALKVMNAMQNLGIALDSCTYHILIKQLCFQGTPEKAMEVLPVMLKNAVFLDVDHYNILIKGFSKQSKPEVALMLYRKMMRVGLQPNVRTYTVMANSFRKMTAKGITPGRILYESVMVGFCRIGDMDGAFDVYEQMLKIGYTPDAVIYNDIIGGFCKINRTDVACALFEDMAREKCVPNEETYDVLIAACRKDGLFVVADKVFAHMKQNGIY